VSRVDVASIVPSTRALLQVLATRRQKLAVVALVDEADAAQDAARLDELSVSAFACAAPGLAMTAVAAATRSVPLLSLAEVADADGALAARARGADGVCVARGLDAARWEAAATAARSTRMLPLATVASKADLDLAIAAGARAALLRAQSVEEAIGWAAAAPRTLTLLAAIEGASLDALRALEKHADAVLIGPALHHAPAFAAFVAAVDP
jgi:indole-3-glycerol phosphate synthase